VAVAFLVVSVVGALLTLNGLRPPRRPDVLGILAFFPSWLVSELPLHQVAWQAAAAALFIGLGALDRGAGRAALVITVVSWLGVAVLVRRSAATAEQVESALRAGLGDGYRAGVDPQLAEEARWRRRHLVQPFGLAGAPVTIARDVPYRDSGQKAHRLDIYRPADGRADCPTVLFLHGGAWVIGDKREQGIPLMAHLASRGWVCVTANYRLSPAATFPDQLLDAKAALRWIRQHGAEHGADPAFVIVSGASAGGQLAALMALTANRPAYQPGFEEVDTSVQGCLCWYGVYDLTNRLGARGRGFVRFIERTVVKRKPADHRDAWEAASPVDQVRPDAPPTMIVHGSNDTLVPPPEARHFAERLSAVSTAPVVYAELRGAQHAFDVFRSVRTLHAVHAAGRFCGYVHATAKPAPPLTVPGDVE
jgi:acetyl esterase/lipase